jgi:hypothetical protein
MKCLRKEVLMNNSSNASKKSDKRSRAIKSLDRKNELIDGLTKTRNQILELSLALAPSKHDQIFLGIWTIKDTVAHLIGWDETNRKALKAILSGRLPHFYAYIDHDWRKYNARLVSKYKRDKLAELVSTMRVSH